MKNLKIYKGALALTTTLGIVLFSGCTINNRNYETTSSIEESIDIATQKSDTCTHLIVEFGGQPVIFRECDGYYIEYENFRGRIYYSVSNDYDTIINGGVTDRANYYEANHKYIDEIEEKAIEKGAYVYKLN